MADMIYSQAGAVRVEDGRTLVHVAAGSTGFALHGPYAALPAGVYSVRFHVALAASDGARDEVCGYIDIGEGGRSIVAREFTRADLDDGRGVLDLGFSIEAGATLEFRVFSNGRAALVVEHEHVLTKQGTGLFAPGTEGEFAITKYRGFLLRNLELFRALAGHGALVQPTERGGLVTLFGVTLRFENVDDFQVIVEILIHNTYAFALGRPTCVIDVGMNVGLASLYFAAMPHVVRVHSFEPFKVPFERALENFRLNPGIAGKIHPQPVGLSDRNAERTVLYGADSTVGATLGGLAEGVPASISIRDAGEVMRGLIGAARAEGLAVAVKLDCEGSEFPIFERLRAADLLREIDLFLIEWHKGWAPGTTQKDLLDPLMEQGFIVLDHTIAANPHAGQLYAVRAMAA